MKLLESLLVYIYSTIYVCRSVTTTRAYGCLNTEGLKALCLNYEILAGVPALRAGWGHVFAFRKNAI